MSAALTRVLKPGMTGKDVQALRRAELRLLGRAMPTADLDYQRTFNKSMTALTKAAQADFDLPESGWAGPRLAGLLREAGCFKAFEDQLLEQYADEQKPRLVEPNQGFDSLHSSLWKAYSLGRSRYGLSDLGTYNPASRLPSGAPSDHAVHPALAFDLGIEPDTGWNNLKARAYVLQIAGWREIEYVILGDRIYFGRTHREYRSGGHLGHLHVSGLR